VTGLPSSGLGRAIFRSGRDERRVRGESLDDHPESRDEVRLKASASLERSPPIIGKPSWTLIRHGFSAEGQTRFARPVDVGRGKNGQRVEITRHCAVSDARL